MAKNIKSLAEIEKDSENTVLLNFYADWSEPCKALNSIVDQFALMDPSSKLSFCNVEAEDGECEKIVEHFNVTSVPTFVFAKGSTEIERLEGADAPSLSKLILKYKSTTVAASASNSQKGSTTQNTTSPTIDLDTKLKNLINSAPVMLFMKGIPDAPECGFSRKTVDLLNTEGIDFNSFNILSDDEVRQGLKTFSNWPTYPQLYHKGELLGGLDILKEMQEEGELDELKS